MLECKYDIKATFYSEPLTRSDNYDVVKTGRTKDDWDKEFDIYCKVKTRGGREVYRSNITNPEVDKVLLVPWNSKSTRITPDWRVILNGKEHSLVSAVNVDEADKQIRIECVEFDASM